MSEMPMPDDAETDPVQTPMLTVDVEANDLPYVLEGEIPAEPGNFDLVARLPDQIWEGIRPRVEKKISEDDWFARLYRTTQQSLHLGDGRVGSVWVTPQASPDGAPTVHVNRIQTELGYMPEDSEYHNAKRVGSMILDSLCAIADLRGWRITLYPLERSGRLMGTDLQNWYRRRGFKFRFEEEDEEREKLYPPDDMLRFPQTPDPSSPVVEALTKIESHV